MQFKTFFVLSLACSLFSGSLSAFEYENSSSSDGYEPYDNPPVEFGEPINDPVFDDGRYDGRDRYYDDDTVRHDVYRSPRATREPVHYASRLPQKIPPPGERVIIINPRFHVWGAYTETGSLIRGGLATSGARWCSDIGRPCRTRTGVFRIYSLGDSDCISSIYPLGEGGAPMPYCMFFHGGQGIHGSDHLADANLSHGCVRVSVNDAEWIRYHFAARGTKVIIESY
ncbi:MAG TPA: L,D-transpeptidase [Gammaproteobacteria bacterium]|nr:L,D-transpeptidase [Gammaproteobacteria bacterium]